MTSVFDNESEDGLRLGDLTRAGGLGEIVDRETAVLRRERDDYREGAVKRELRLRELAAVEADIAAEADLRSSPPNLRAV